MVRLDSGYCIQLRDLRHGIGVPEGCQENPAGRCSTAAARGRPVIRSSGGAPCGAGADRRPHTAGQGSWSARTIRSPYTAAT